MQGKGNRSKDISTAGSGVRGREVRSVDLPGKPVYPGCFGSVSSISLGRWQVVDLGTRQLAESLFGSLGTNWRTSQPGSGGENEG